MAIKGVIVLVFGLGFVVALIGQLSGLVNGLGRLTPDPTIALERPLDGREKQDRVPWRAEKAGRFEKARRLLLGNHHDAFPAPSLDDDRLPVLRDLVEDLGEVLPGLGVRDMKSHGFLPE